ncbi:MAG: PhoH family protein [Spirochaetaceae bacterium]|nr:PhoH family protein [Spirochaetaceae bacterium]
MEEMYTIVLDTPEVVAALCGPNDKHIQLFEECFGVPIVTRGNEIILMSNDTKLTEHFENVIMQLAHSPHIHGSEADEFIASSLKQISESGNTNTKVEGIHIPRSTKAVYPKNARQAEFIKAIQTHDLTFGIGPAGTGKTYIATALALQMLLEKRVQKIVLTRPVVEAGENLGFLPGDLIQKITPYLRPLYDIIEHLLPPFQFRRLEEDGLFEVAPLAYMRGRTLFRSVVILDEAQNTSAEQMKMFLTRLGPESKMIITGDPGQSDIQHGKNSGLAHAVSLLKSIDDIAIVTFTSKDVVRHSLVQKIINAYEQS